MLSINSYFKRASNRFLETKELEELKFLFLDRDKFKKNKKELISLYNNNKLSENTSKILVVENMLNFLIYLIETTEDKESFIQLVNDIFNKIKNDLEIVVDEVDLNTEDYFLSLFSKGSYAYILRHFIKIGEFINTYSKKNKQVDMLGVIINLYEKLYSKGLIKYYSYSGTRGSFFTLELNSVFLISFLNYLENYKLDNFLHPKIKKYFIYSLKLAVNSNFEYNLKFILKKIVDLKDDYLKEIIEELLKYLTENKKLLSNFFLTTKNKNLEIFGRIIEKIKILGVQLKILYKYLAMSIELYLTDYRYINALIDEFTIDLITYLKTKNKYNNLITKIIKEKDIIPSGNYNLIAKFIEKEEINDFIQWFVNKEKKYVVFFVYDFIKKQKGKENYKIIFENSILGEEIKNREKQLNNRKKEFQEIEQKKKNQMKKELLRWINTINEIKNKNVDYIPSIYHLLNLYKNVLSYKVFDNNDELNSVVLKVVEIVEEYLDKMGISEIDDKIVRKYLFFKQEDNTYYFSNLFGLIQDLIDLKLNINWYKYQKIMILYFPLFLNIEDKYLNLIELVDKQDIDYLLKLYAGEYSINNIEGIRYYMPLNLIAFYNKFKDSFSLEQKEKYKNILENLVYSEKIELYPKIRIIGELGENSDKSILKKILKEYEAFLKVNIKNYNYYKDAIVNEKGLEKKTLDYINIVAYIRKILIEKYKDKNSIEWLFEQLLNGEIKCQELSGTHLVGKCEDELRLRSNFLFGNHLANALLNFEHIFDSDNLKNMLRDVFNYGINIIKQINSGEKDKAYRMYGEYLIFLFLGYIEKYNTKIKNKLEFFKSLFDDLKSEKTAYFLYIINRLEENFGIPKMAFAISEAEKILKEEPKEIIESVANIIYDLESSKVEKYKVNEENEKLKKEIEYINRLNTSNNVILLVEGYSDQLYLEYFYNLYKDEDYKRPYIIPVGGLKEIKEIIKNHINHGYFSSDKIVIGMLDLDYAGKTTFNTIEGLLENSTKEKINGSFILFSENMKVGIFTVPITKYSKDFVITKNNYNENVEDILYSSLSIETLLYWGDKFEKSNGLNNFFTDLFDIGENYIEVKENKKIEKVNKLKKILGQEDYDINMKKQLFNNFKTVGDIINLLSSQL